MQVPLLQPGCPAPPDGGGNGLVPGSALARCLSLPRARKRLDTFRVLCSGLRVGHTAGAQCAHREEWAGQGQRPTGKARLRGPAQGPTARPPTGSTPPNQIFKKSLWATQLTLRILFYSRDACPGFGSFGWLPPAGYSWLPLPLTLSPHPYPFSVFLCVWGEVNVFPLFWL